jgi:hypothetical protein
MNGNTSTLLFCLSNLITTGFEDDNPVVLNPATTGALYALVLKVELFDSFVFLVTWNFVIPPCPIFALII